jgi:hypothetical protein
MAASVHRNGPSNEVPMKRFRKLTWFQITVGNRPVAVEKLASEKSAKIKTRREALQRIISTT